jgi:hypothetical protein
LVGNAGQKLYDKDKFCSVCGAATAKVTREEFTVSSDGPIEKVKQLFHEGNVTRIIVKDEKVKVMLEMPATIGAIGVLLARWLVALRAIAALAANCRIVVERRE